MFNYSLSLKIILIVISLVGLRPAFAEGCAVENSHFVSSDGGCKHITTNIVLSPDSQHMFYVFNKVSVSYAEGLSYCQGLRTGGFSDWRFPTRQEAVAIATSAPLQAIQSSFPRGFDQSRSDKFFLESDPIGSPATRECIQWNFLNNNQFCSDSGKNIFRTDGGPNIGNVVRMVCVRKATSPTSTEPVRAHARGVVKSASGVNIELGGTTQFSDLKVRNDVSARYVKVSDSNGKAIDFVRTEGTIENQHLKFLGEISNIPNSPIGIVTATVDLGGTKIFDAYGNPIEFHSDTFLGKEIVISGTYSIQERKFVETSEIKIIEGTGFCYSESDTFESRGSGCIEKSRPNRIWHTFQPSSSQPQTAADLYFMQDRRIDLFTPAGSRCFSTGEVVPPRAQYNREILRARCQRLNTNRAGGITTWRMPTSIELQDLFRRNPQSVRHLLPEVPGLSQVNHDPTESSPFRWVSGDGDTVSGNVVDRLGNIISVTAPALSVTTGGLCGANLHVTDLDGTFNRLGSSIDEIVGTCIADVVDSTVRNPTTIIRLEDGDLGVTVKGPWFAANTGYIGDLRYIASSSLFPGQEIAEARWEFAGITPGVYRISTTFQTSSSLQGGSIAASNAPYSVFDGSSELGLIRINQNLQNFDFNEDGANWKDLAAAVNITTDRIIIKLSNEADQKVIADGIRIERIGNLDSSFTFLGRVAPPNPNSAAKISRTPNSIKIGWQSGGETTVDFVVALSVGIVAPVSCIGGTNVGSAIAYEATNLSPNSSYAFRICARNAEGILSSGVVFNGETAVLPSNPSNGTVVLTTNSSIRIGWNPVPSNTYVVSFSKGNSAPSCEAGANVSEPNFIATALEENADYAFRVCSKSGEGFLSSGLLIEARTLQSPPPPAPTMGTLLSSSADSLKVGWENAGGNTVSFVVAHGLKAAAPANCDSGTDVGLVTEFKASSLKANSAYVFRVCAKSANGLLSLGLLINAKTLARPPVPLAGKVVSATSRSLVVSWGNAGGTTTGFVVAFGPSSSRPLNCDLGTSVGLDLNFRAEQLKEKTSYTFLVCSKNSKGTLSSPRTFSAKTLPLPPKPTKPKLNAATTTSLSIGWTSGGGSTQRFLISVRNGATAPENCLNAIDVGSNQSFTATGLVKGTRYTFRICSVDAEGAMSIGATLGARTTNR